LARFGLVLVAFMAVSWTANQRLFDTLRPALADGATIMALGDSHIATGVPPNPSVGLANVATHGEPYIATYFKLRALLAANPQVEAIVLGFGHHNLSSFNDRKFADSAWAPAMQERYYPLISWSEVRAQKIEVAIGERAKAMVRYELFPNRTYLENLLAVWAGGREPLYPYVVGFDSRPGSRLDRTGLDSIIRRHYVVDGRPADVSPTAVAYLERSLELATTSGVQVWLLATPVHPDYRRSIPEGIASRFAELSERLSERFEGVQVIDLTRERWPDSMFYNYDHLNRRGADSLSRRLASLFAHPGRPTRGGPSRPSAPNR
jgi:hypothetical protein